MFCLFVSGRRTPGQQCSCRLANVSGLLDRRSLDPLVEDGALDMLLFEGGIYEGISVRIYQSVVYPYGYTIVYTTLEWGVSLGLLGCERGRSKVDRLRLLTHRTRTSYSRG